MNIYNILATFVVVLIQLMHSPNHRVLAPLLDAPEYDTTYSICFIITPPSVPLTIDPSPPVLAPPFDPEYAPIPPHTFVGATSAGHGADSFSVNWMVNLAVMVSGLFVHVSTSPSSNTTLRSLADHIRLTRQRSRGSPRTSVSQLEAFGQ